MLAKVVITGLLLVPYVSGANILFFTLLATYSHRLAIWPLAERLADAGHNVTFLSSFVNKTPHPKITDIVPQMPMEFMRDWVGEFDINLKLNGTSDIFNQVFQVAHIICHLFLEDPGTLPWVNSSTFDLVFVDCAFNDCGYPLAYKFKAPVIIFGTLSTTTFWSEAFGYHPEGFPEMEFHVHPDPSKRTFIDEVINTISPIRWHLRRKLDTLPKLEQLFKTKLNMQDLPSIEQLQSQTRLVLSNGHYSTDYGRSLPPMFISVPGMHVKTQHSPLPQHLQDFLQDSHFIYISLGSAVVSSKMPVYLRNIFFDVIRNFPNFKFIWRWTGQKPEYFPNNLLLDAWLPQQDILAHPKIKGFITQVGLPSFQEALYNEVPLLCFPIFGDQDYNADLVEHTGLGRNLDIGKVTVDSFQEALNDVVSNDKYRKSAEFHSRIFKDQQITSVDKAFWWTEFVLRYNNTDFLQTIGMKQSWWERRSLHVWAFLFLVTLISIVTLILLCAFILRTVAAFIFSENSREPEKNVDKVWAQKAMMFSSNRVKTTKVA